MHGPPLIEVRTPGGANRLMQEGLQYDGELNDCALLIENCTLTHCFNCYCYDYTAKACKARRYCGFCAKEHDSRNCSTPETSSSHSY
jgi:hypothetical protein